MLRRFIASAAVMFIITGFVLAGEYTGLITKIDKDSVTFKTKKKGEKPEEKTLKLKSAKISKGEESDLKHTDVSKMIDDATGKVKGVRAKITTEGEGDKEVVTKISIGGKKKK